jgi:acyl-coenzyme A thioesterase PaaI-like protein
VSDSFFVAAGSRDDVFEFEPSEHVAGPWSADFMHAGPPGALLAHVIASVAAGSVPEPGFIAGIHFDILRPIPVAPVAVAARVLRPGRRVALVEAQLGPVGAGEPVMLARAWVMRTGDVAVPATRAIDPPGPGTIRGPFPTGWSRGYLDAIEWSWVEGSFEAAGPACAWVRPRYPLLADRESSPVERVLLVADSGSGISATANPLDLVFINTDLSVHLHRPPVGERLWMQSESWLDQTGVGLASTVLGDERGAIGSGEQSLFLAPGPGTAAG